MASAQKFLNDYYLLRTAIEARRENELLGRVVKNKQNPLQSIAPLLNNIDVVPQKLIPGLMGNSTALESFTESSTTNETDSGRMKLTSLASAHAKSEGGSSAMVSAYVLRSHDMVDIYNNFEELKKNPAYLQEIEAIYKRTRADRLPMITKVLMCDEMEIKKGKESSKSMGTEATLPLTALATNGTIPTGPADINTGFERQRADKTENTTKTSGRVIVALAYTWTIRQQAPKTRQSKPIFLGRLKAFFARKDPTQPMEIIVIEDPKEKIYMGDSTSTIDGKLDIVEGSNEQRVHEHEDNV